MTFKLPDNVRPIKDRHGRTRYRFRKKGFRSSYIKGKPGTKEFYASLALALSQESETHSIASPRPVERHSLDDLVRHYKSGTKWRKKSARTQLIQGRTLERFCDRIAKNGRRYGSRQVASVTVAWLDGVFGEMSETPAAADYLRKVLNGAFRYAVKSGWRSDNPVTETDYYGGGGGFHDWTDAEIQKFRGAHPLGTMARLTLELALNTAARRCNINKIERDHIRDGRIVVAHAKGNNETSVPMLSTTRAALEALPATPIRFLITTQFGKPFTDAGMGNRMRKWCDDAGLPNCTMHGLRKAMSRRLAEHGATDAEGMAVTGHKKPETFAYYRANANRSALADRAMSNLEPKVDVQPIKNSDKTDD